MKITPSLQKFLDSPPGRVLAWGSASNPEVSAILAGQGQSLDRDAYLIFLANRIEKMVEDWEDPQGAEAVLRQQLEDAGLLDESAGLTLREVITSNLPLQAKLSSLGALPKKGEKVEKENPEARIALKEIGLEEWLSRVAR